VDIKERNKTKNGRPIRKGKNLGMDLEVSARKKKTGELRVEKELE
jgi:hypothetical protein